MFSFEKKANTVLTISFIYTLGIKCLL